MRKLPIIAAAILSACSKPGGPYPTLAPRPAERIDPRVAVVRPMNDRPVSASLAAQLSALVAQARSGDVAFQPLAARAEQLASGAGAPQTEGWTVAQEALSAAMAARGPTAAALADVDSLAATMLHTQGGIAPNDLDALDHAAAEIGDVAGRQTDRIRAIQRKLGI